MKIRRQYQVPMTEVHKIFGPVVLIANTGSSPDALISNGKDSRGNNPNDSRRGYWDDWDDDDDE